MAPIAPQPTNANRTSAKRVNASLPNPKRKPMAPIARLTMSAIARFATKANVVSHRHVRSAMKITARAISTFTAMSI